MGQSIGTLSDPERQRRLREHYFKKAKQANKQTNKQTNKQKTNNNNKGKTAIDCCKSASHNSGIFVCYFLQKKKQNKKKKQANNQTNEQTYNAVLNFVFYFNLEALSTNPNPG